MKNFKYFMTLQILPCILFLTSMQAKIVEFVEDAYTMQAPKEIIDITEKAAALFDFTTPYEVAVPKKAGIQINPWNKFIAYTINPFTKNPLIIVNSEWFLKMPEDQQLFLLGRNFLTLSHGAVPFSMKIIPYLFMLLSLCLLLLLFWALGKTALKNQKTWIRFIAAYSIIMAFNLAFMNTLQTKTLRYFGMQYDTKINKLVLEKTKNKDAAIKALEFFDSSIKNELKDGEAFWASYENLFENYAHDLKK